jgi:beta-glucanase (GH16 family)
MSLRKTFHWCGYEWLTQERWGQIHKEKRQAYYDKNSVILRPDGSISLLTQWKPKILEIDGKKVKSINAVGLISCLKHFTWGRFEIKARLPEGRWLWPAFWLWAWGDWPPEIDIFEAYSSKHFGYFRPSINNPSLYNIESNVHTRGNYVHTPPARDHWIGFKSPNKTHMIYALEWRKDSLKFFYNDKLVRTVTNKSTMDYLNEYSMNLVINNMIRNVAPKGHTEYSDFNIKYFTYTKY